MNFLESTSLLVWFGTMDEYNMKGSLFTIGACCQILCSVQTPVVRVTVGCCIQLVRVDDDSKRRLVHKGRTVVFSIVYEKVR
jgi:hypothetical protein